MTEFAKIEGLLNGGNTYRALQALASFPSREDSPQLAALRDRAKRAAVPFWHYAMMNDLDRNQGFVRAFKALGLAGADVLEIGTGAGLLAMLLSQENPKSLVTCEASPVMFEAAQRVFAANGYSDRIRAVNKLSNELEIGTDLAGKVDFIVAEIVDEVLVGEGILPSLRDARERLLKVGGRIVPSSMRLKLAPFSSEFIHKTSFVGRSMGFDISSFNEHATRVHRNLVLGLHPHAMLGEPATVFEKNLLTDDLSPFGGSVSAPIAVDGVVHGYALWFELELAPGVWISNAPNEVNSHWGQSVHMIEHPRKVAPGEVLSVGFEVTDFHFLLRA